ncbi:MAG: UDP-N-acetylmuramate:L-alanyl-gamma-D-glutamyl-meso-diaminopimelate ligase [Desulfobacter sp.]|nr:MAG: UDP-N-acetylmuramate:L-alanyl-gamma-D-glutamyl-meso-diaminopimelate ligase [Desulfobacter sp.]
MKDSIRHIHLTAACGTGMGTLACILKKMGYKVTGSDQNVYPPMSDFLEENGIRLFSGFSSSNISRNPAPDLVIIGNAVSRDNPEASAVLEQGIPYMSMPQAVNHFIAKDKKIILVTGTHGKTTTSSIMAHLLETAGLSPSFMVGGILKDFNSSFQIGSGQYMVIEGDEYDTAFFDKGPKFMHYDPEITIMTGIEFDHADIFTDLDHICRVFEAFVLKIKETSTIIACNESPTLIRVLAEAGASALTYGDQGDIEIDDHGTCGQRTRARIKANDGDILVDTPMQGRHNLLNASACIAAARKLDISDEKIAQGLASFSGVKRRQEIRGIQKGITVMDDFAHHPSAVRETIAAVKPFYSKGRVIAVFEPRTNTSMRNIFQKEYPRAFTGADMVIICNPCVKKSIPEDQRFSTARLAHDIETLGTRAGHFETVDQVIEFLTPQLKDKDLVLIMSNGGFGNIHERLLEKIG